MVYDHESVSILSTEASSTLYHDSFSCISEGLEWPLTVQSSAKDMLPEIPVISRKHPRSYGLLPSPEIDQPNERFHTFVSYRTTTQLSIVCKDTDPGRPKLNHSVLAIFSFAKRGIGISVQLIEGFRDEIADSLSRDASLESECSLDGTSFQFNQVLVPDLQMDPFATASITNCHCTWFRRWIP